MSMTASKTVGDLIPAGRHGCPVCPQRFDTVGDKKRHVRTNHSSTLPKPEK